ncbi:UDP-N-acetylmuramoyl-tripeptide--D-alanyl-D-alanine ligase [Apilactobacillus sp. TMW 2.2459]|uniref:UDP-N-acetylmuramoyl-tripeptide--D-alanyl-D- alanine ligase n=1 Tax=Apilactobacillus xinyiensis TaxID=2841032 RepID=UPI00200CE74A|nr:UDP-N-acetylmuramoyl-tripeptide--D-alanyl-D-alanine ligase [Apilactobacillus xinyiensis]MCL0312872.1 UDP-N-acetylmuramoyl-tripeptide--D-alanyl-D-alanine ligase [Apilactobacillus xinyiensis]
MKMSLAEINRAVDSKSDVSKYQDIEVTSVAFDSRNLKPGALFIPLVDKNDGHDYINDAIKNGAVATLWQNNHKNQPLDFPVLQVNDTLDALQELAKYYLIKINPRVIAVTGSNGKTTTKDMIASVLSTQFNVTKTHANFNNEIGVPITVLSMEPNTEMLVIEMGMDRPGQLDHLSRLVQPDIAIITMIGEAHIEFFGTRDKIADAKMEITHGLKADGTFVYNGDEPLLNERAEDLNFRKFTFGSHKNNDYYVESINNLGNAINFEANKWEKTQFKINMLGNYNVNNALAALVVGDLYHIQTSNLQQALDKLQVTENRAEWINGSKGERILSDVYNSNPTAVKEVLKAFTNDSSDKRKIVVLGDMLELGSKSKELHESLADSFDINRIQKVYLIGNDIKALYDKLRLAYPADNVIYYQTKHLRDLSEALNDDISENDEVLLKASHGIHLEKVLKHLTTEK